MKPSDCYTIAFVVLVLFIPSSCNYEDKESTFHFSGKVFFVSFAGGTSPVHLANQAMQKVPNKQFIPGLTQEFFENDKTIGSAYYDRLSTELKESKRGFHYWSWKPFVVLKTMQQVPLNSIIVYLDAGAYLTNDISRLLSYAEKCGRVFFNNSHDNTGYCKCEPVHAFIPDEAKRKVFFKTRQLDAAFFVLLNTPANQKFVETWLQSCLNYSYVSDKKSVCCKESETFLDHRHDQALLTLLRYSNHNGDTLLPFTEKFRYINHHRRRSL